jgi:DNA processing protein
MSEKSDVHLICFALKEYGEVGPKLFQQLLLTYGHPKNIFAQTADDISAMIGINIERATKIVETEHSLEQASQQIEDLQSVNVKIISYFDDCYPEAFRIIADPPLAFYHRGDEALLDKGGIAIVGTTSADQAGIRAAVDFAKRFAKLEKTVVSGLALGIDTAAHLGSIQNNGKTIAVLGCGHLNIYPEENAPLASLISESGAVISEFEINADAIPGRLVSRNRLISALADAVLIVQMGESRKGELHAARAAAEQGKLVYIYDPDNSHEEIDIGQSYITIHHIEQVEEIAAAIIRI